MNFETPLIKGTILKRYKRFLADIELENGEIITAHTANTGSMTTCWEPGWDVLISYHDNPKRKLKYSLEMTNNGESWIGVNTSLPNKLAIEAIKNETITELLGYETIKPEVKIGESRIDILLKDGANGDNCYVEVKNVTMLGENQLAIFPDSVTLRGQKHLRELTSLAQQNIRAVMLFIVQRQDVNSFSPAKEIDPEYALLLNLAKKAGVEILAYQCKLDSEKILVTHSIPVIL